MLSRLLVLATVCFALGSGCSSTDPEDEEMVPDGLTEAEGDGQTAAPGATLPTPLTVQVGEDGEPVQGQSVMWTVTAGGGSVSQAESTTGSDGRATTMWTLGPNNGTNRVEASASGLAGSPVVFTATASTPSPAPTTAEVSIEDFFFDPSSTRLASGGTVTWEFNGGVAHNVTFASGPNSDTQSSGTFSRTFGAAGSFSYSCTIHPQMTGTIDVE